MGIGLLVGGVRRDPWISWTPPPPGGGAWEGGGTPFWGGPPLGYLGGSFWGWHYYGKIDERKGLIDDMFKCNTLKDYGFCQHVCQRQRYKGSRLAGSFVVGLVVS